MKKIIKQKNFKAFAAGLILVFCFGLGFFVRGFFLQLNKGVSIKNLESDISQKGDFGIFWETWKKLEEKYPFNDEEPSVQERIYAATEGMVRSFNDPHTSFLPPTETKHFSEEVLGEFGGVGMEVGMRDNMIIVIAPLKGSPAEKAGIMSGDVIYKVDGVEVYNKNTDEVIALIREKRGTPVTVTILRMTEVEPLDITIVRDLIEIPSINTQIVGDIFVIELYSFNAHATQLFRDALKTFRESGKKKLIVDVRSNPGGFLDAAVDITSMFLPQGLPIVRERGAGGVASERVYRSFGTGEVPPDTKIIVLVNGGSASAAEIFAAALREHNRARLVGTDTFGKGSVQEFMMLSDQSSLKVTVARWFTPEGVSISEHGYTPDYEVPFTFKDITEGRDPQFQKAQELLAEEDVS